MKNYRNLLGIILLLCASCLASAQTKLVSSPPAVQTQASFNYVKLIQDRYKDIAAKFSTDTGMKTWREGMLKDYGLILNHAEMTFKSSSINTTTDNKTLVCGILIIVGYGETIDGTQKRIFSKRAVCHLFNGGKLEDSLTIGSNPNVLLDGWSDDALPI